MNYLSEKSEKINVFEVNNALYVIEVNPSDNSEGNYNVIGSIENILYGKYTVIKNIVSEEVDDVDMTQAIYAHVFILHESIADLPLNNHKWSKNKIFFDFLGHDDTYLAMVSSYERVEELKKQKEISENPYLKAEMVESLSVGLMFALPDAGDNDGQEIEYLKVNEKIVGFRIQGVGKIYDIEMP